MKSKRIPPFGRSSTAYPYCKSPTLNTQCGVGIFVLPSLFKKWRRFDDILERSWRNDDEGDENQ